jgi:ribose/xylose/arabinose/galactoside ABC-type transport system permease subunit
MSYPRADGWTLQPFPAPGVLLHTSRVNPFFNSQNLVGVAKDASFIAIMAVGMAGVIILGGIDLSVGSVYALAAVVGAYALRALGAGAEGGTGWLSVPAGVLVCAAIGGACGLMNGFATVGLRVHPFIITLGGMAAYRGVAFVITDGQSISGFPDSYTVGFFRSSTRGVNPVPMAVMVLVALAGWFVLSQTVFGRQTYAIGGNETAARYAGVRVGRVKIATGS